MAVANNLDQYRAIQQRRIEKLQSGKRRGPTTAAKYMAAQLRRLAPRDSGRLINSIHREKNSVRVSGANPLNGFPYIHWVNATPGSGLERVKLVPPFGDGGVYSYAQVARTGTPEFHQIALMRTREVFSDAMISVSRNVLSSEF